MKNKQAFLPCLCCFTFTFTFTLSAKTASPGESQPLNHPPAAKPQRCMLISPCYFFQKCWDMLTSRLAAGLDLRAEQTQPPHPTIAQPGFSIFTSTSPPLFLEGGRKSNISLLLFETLGLRSEASWFLVLKRRC